MKKRTALLIIDMQNDFVREGAPFRVAGALAVVKNVRKVLEAFRRSDMPIFHVVRIHRKDASDVEITRKNTFSKTPFAVENTEGADIIDELRPRGNEYIIKKNRMSAFFNTDLDLMLRSHGIDRIVVAGIQTPNCIRTTAFDAIALNYSTYLVEDAVAAGNNSIHESNVTDMRNIGINTIRTDEVEGILT